MFSNAGFRHGEDKLEFAPIEADTDDIELLKEEANMANPSIQDGEEILADDKLDRLLDEDPGEEQKMQEASDEETTGPVQKDPIMTAAEARTSLLALERFFTLHGKHDEAAQCESMHVVTDKIFKDGLRQPSILEFFKR